MNDEMKGKSGKVKVMYVRSDDSINVPTTRVPGKKRAIEKIGFLTAITNKVNPYFQNGKIK